MAKAEAGIHPSTLPYLHQHHLRLQSLFYNALLSLHALYSPPSPPRLPDHYYRLVPGRVLPHGPA